MVLIFFVFFFSELTSKHLHIAPKHPYIIQNILIASKHPYIIHQKNLLSNCFLK